MFWYLNDLSQGINRVDVKKDDKGKEVYTLKSDMDNEAFVTSPEFLLRSNEEIMRLAPKEQVHPATRPIITPPISALKAQYLQQ